MLIEVRQSHIRCGEPRSYTRCPIALALSPYLGETPFVVDCDQVCLQGAKRKLHLPRSAQRFIALFDEGKPVKPFRFRL